MVLASAFAWTWQRCLREGPLQANVNKASYFGLREDPRHANASAASQWCLGSDPLHAIFSEIHLLGKPPLDFVKAVDMTQTHLQHLTLLASTGTRFL